MKSKHPYILLALIVLMVCAGVLIAQQGEGKKVESPATQGKLQDGKEYRVRAVDSPKPRQVPELALRSLEIVRVEEGSVIGQPGDWVISITGQGFLETDKSPIVHLDKGISLDETYSNAEGNVLHAVLPKALAERLGRQDLSMVRVQNPGGLNAPEQKWARLPMEKGQMQKLMQDAKPARFSQGEYFIEMKR